ncbi:MAG TPA: RNA 2',3'-cyclic phosphodiesterase [Sphingomonas sp.]|nr:RNA 2',3'-cyclic phosphodiesterase [Sphingomonas sp.]
MHRLFVALRPPRDIRALLIAAMGGVRAARWQDDEQLHLTLRFIGEVDRPVAEDVAAALGSVHAPPITAAIAGVGRFDRRGRTDAIWAGVAPGDALAALHAKVDRALVRLGLDPERRAYLPHITLARLPRAGGSEHEVERFLADHAGLASPPFAFTHLTLFESRLGQEGARYTPVTRWPLG